MGATSKPAPLLDVFLAHLSPAPEPSRLPPALDERLERLSATARRGDGR